MKDVRVPKVGMSTIEVEIGEVFVSLGQRVQAASVIVSVAADKVDFDVEAGVEGTVEEILVTEGAVVEVGMVIARIREES
jgi:pyruvate/2-oxoglutarate dehydrogenase complex dihydrolipoamide acyltransferase (E2) component